MSEPSKEAVERAERIVGHLASERKWGAHEARDHIATAIQELMDERDDIQKAASDNWDEAIREGHARIQAEKRAEAAEAKLAECVRRVREWTELWNDGATTVPGLRAILADYAPKTEEPGR